MFCFKNNIASTNGICLSDQLHMRRVFGNFLFIYLCIPFGAADGRTIIDLKQWKCSKTKGDWFISKNQFIHAVNIGNLLDYNGFVLEMMVQLIHLLSHLKTNTCTLNICKRLKLYHPTLELSGVLNERLSFHSFTKTFTYTHILLICWCSFAVM